jgi:hypothetical protein
VAKAFVIRSDGNINVRVLLALAYRSHFGDKAFDNFGITCQHLVTGPDGRKVCTQHSD